LRAFFACGGTGGHIYPAIAVAEVMKEKYGAEPVFGGSDTGMEGGIIRKHGYEFYALAARPLIRRPDIRNICNMLANMKSFFDALSIIGRLKPDIVIGTGGFVSFPFVLAASVSGVKTLIHEPNVAPGLANRLLSPFVSRITTGFKETADGFATGRAEATGNPVRRAVEKAYSRRKKASRTLLVMPGSRAAEKINRVMAEAMPRLAREIKGLRVIWMSGKAGFKGAKSAARGFKEVKVVEYVHDAAAAYAACGVALLRAGASTLSEVAATGTAAILVPYPHAAGGHQEKNALMFARKKAAIVIRDAELDAKTLVEAVSRAMKRKVNAELGKNARKLHVAGGAEKIAAIAVKEAGK